jgi:hypothetical protein
VAAAAVSQAGGTRNWAALFAASGFALWLAGYQDAQAGDIDMVTMADRLADQVRVRWDAEAQRWEISNPALPLSWRPADSSLVQPRGVDTAERGD